MRHSARRLAPLSFVLVAAACASLPGPWRRQEAQDAWVQSFVEAERLAQEGRVARADSVLAHYAEEHAASPEATETLYWRALLKLDPAHAAGTPAEAVRLLDRYLDAKTPTTHSMEARSLRRTAQALDSLGRSVVTARAAADTANAALTALRATPAVPDELQKLKDELAKTQAELERIRRRLSNPQGRP